MLMCGISFEIRSNLIHGQFFFSWLTHCFALFIKEATPAGWQSLYEHKTGDSYQLCFNRSRSSLIKSDFPSISREQKKAQLIFCFFARFPLDHTYHKPQRGSCWRCVSNENIYLRLSSYLVPKNFRFARYRDLDPSEFE